MNTKVIARRTVNRNIGISFCDAEFLRRSCESRDVGGSRDGSESRDVDGSRDVSRSRDGRTVGINRWITSAAVMDMTLIHVVQFCHIQ